MVEIKKNRKRWFSIRNKLIAIQLLTVFIILSIYSVINFFNNNKLYKASVVQKLESIVSILGYNCRSPLNFLDQSAAEDILSSLGSEANVVNAWLYNGDDQLFATYVKAGHERVPAPGGNREYAEFSKDAFLISRWIIQDNDIIGTVILKFDMTPYQRVLSRNILIGIIILIGGMVLALILSIFNQKSISDPLLQLVSTLKQVGDSGDYSIRTEKSRDDEIGLLYDGFNEMLGRIQQRERDRDIAEESLHKKVQEITALNTLSQKVSSSLSIDQVVHSSLEGIKATVNPDFGLFFLKTAERLLHQGPVPTDMQTVEIERLFKFSQKVCMQAIECRTAVYSSSTEAQEIQGELNNMFRSFAAIPLFGRDEIIAVIILLSKTERQFNESGTLLKTMTNEIAIGLQNAILFEQINKYSNELEKRVEERTQELSEANEELKSIDRMKSMFLASMSHELRTPLNSIIGFTGLLLMGMAGEMNAEQQKQLNLVKNSANHLLSLITDILDISKIESGKVSLNIDSIQITELIDEVVASVTPTLKSKGLDIHIQVRENLTVSSDRRRVKQLIINLVSNAIKFTDHGSITIEAKQYLKNKIEISVSDTGIGIRKEDMASLFKPFQQIDMSSTKKHEGTGLGLYHCKKLLEFLNGEIFAVSTYGRGSVFYFRLPVEFSDKEEKDSEKSTGH